MVDALATQVFGRQCGRREVDRGQPGDQLTVRLFGEWLAQVVASEAGLQMGDWNASIEGRQGAGERGCRVALDEDEGRPDVVDGPIERVDRARCEAGERLIGAHELEVDIRPRPNS